MVRYFDNSVIGYLNPEETSGWPWTYVTPPFNLTWEGRDTGEYIIGGEEFITNDKGESYISYLDFAKATVDIAENRNISARVCVC
jgi:hypothetical protein